MVSAAIINSYLYTVVKGLNLRLKLKSMFLWFRITAFTFFLFPFLFGQFNTEPGAGKPTVAILDFEARGVKTLLNQTEQPGYKSIRWNGRNNAGQEISAGMYFYRLETTGFVKVHKMVLLK